MAKAKPTTDAAVESSAPNGTENPATTTTEAEQQTAPQEIAPAVTVIGEDPFTTIYSLGKPSDADSFSESITVAVMEIEGVGCLVRSTMTYGANISTTQTFIPGTRLHKDGDVYRVVRKL